jgi:RNA polymerase-binding transcription factor DksA
MTLQQREYLAGQLASRCVALLRQFREQRARVCTPVADDGDPVDRALDEIDRGTDQLLMELERREIRRLIAAQQRLLSERFGICRRCGGDIDPRRLVAQPDSPLCVECARELEQRRHLH